MEKMTWEQISISISYKSGQITDKRIEKIVDELKKYDIFVTASVRPNPDVAIFMLGDKGGAFVIAPENLTYNIPFVEDRFLIAKRELSVIMDIMSVEDKNAYVINAQGSSPSNNSHDETREEFNQTHGSILSQYCDIYGVGYRFLIKNEEYSGEFKIEPMVSDFKKYYFQYIINTTDNVTLDDLFVLIEKCLGNDFESLRESL